MRAQSARAKKIKRFCRKFFIAPAVRSLEAESQFLCGLSKRPCEGPGRGGHARFTGSSNKGTGFGRGVPRYHPGKKGGRGAGLSRFLGGLIKESWVLGGGAPGKSRGEGGAPPRPGELLRDCSRF